MANPVPVTYSGSGEVIRGGRWWHALAQFAATVQPGQCLEFAAPNLNSYDATEGYWFGPTPGVTGAVGPMDSAWASCMDLDPVTQSVYFAGGRPLDQAAPQKVVWYDARANAWQSRSGWSGLRGGHIYRSTCVIPNHRRVVYEPTSLQGLCAVWDIDTNTLAGTIPSCPTNIANGKSSWQPAPGLVWHPNLGAQGSIVRANASLSRVTRFDWATQTWSAIGRFDATAAWTNNHIAGHYNRFADAVIVGASRPSGQCHLVIVESDGGSRLAAIGPAATVATGNGNFVPHPSRNASIAFCRDTARVWSYEWVSDTWVNRAPLPSSLDNINCIPASIPHLNVIFVGRWGAGGTSKTFVYRPDF